MKYHKPESDGKPFRKPSGQFWFIEEYKALREKACDDPGEITDLQLGVIESFAGTREADQFAAARAKAKKPPLDVPATPAPMTLAAATAWLLKGFARKRDPAFDRYKFADTIDPADRIVPGAYDRISYMIAVEQFRKNPAALTDHDLQSLEFVYPGLHKKAVAARAGYRKPRTKDDEELSSVLASMPVSARVMLKFVNGMLDDLAVWIHSIQYVARESKVRLDALDGGGPNAVTPIAELESACDGLGVRADRAEATAVRAEAAATTARLFALQSLEKVEKAKASLPSSDRVEALEARLLALEQRSASLQYRGVFDATKTYAAGDLVTWGGSMWHANETTTAKPGDASEASRAWQLCVKKGADGRNGKDAPQ